jgi:hypothetical protein
MVSTFAGLSIATYNWRIGFGFGFGAAYLIPRYGVFDPQLSLGIGDFRDSRLDLFMKVQ